ncbi:MAG: S1C family serine protease, partial [Candidatus Shapirobacteria bacterium]
GVAATATRGIFDERSSVVFLKADYANLTAPAFARYEDITAGVPVWIERRAGSYEPASVALVHGEVGDVKGVPSSVAARRPTVTSFMQAGDVGAPVWDSNGTLLGIASGKPGGTFPFIPASAWAPSLYGIFSDGKILHADIGVRSVDLASLRLVNPRSDLPLLGAWIVTDASTKMSEVNAAASNSASLIAGDVITRVDRDILDGSADLGEVLVQYKPGSQVTLTVVRDGKTIEIPVKLGSVQVSKELK